MRAIRFHQFGQPVEELLKVEEIATPEPGPGEVRVRLTHRPVNPSDLLTVQGLYGRLPQLPATAGAEGVGTVDSVGEGVSGFAVGQRVVPLGVAGTWAEYGIAKAHALLPVPDKVSDESAAQFVVNPVSAWVMLTEALTLKAGDWLLQSAAGSTLGRMVIQLARLKGYRTINLVRRPEQVQELVDLGADAVICTAEESVVERVREVTGGKGATAAIDAVGGETGSAMVSALGPGGTMLVYGLLSGEPVSLNGGELIFRGTGARGFWLVHWFESTPPDRMGATLTELMGLMADGSLVPPVEAQYDLGEVHEAVRHAERPGRSGKVLLIG